MNHGMTFEREGKILEDAVTVFGAGLQMDVAIEEMAELIKALCKYKRLRVVSADAAEVIAAIREEMADVGIMLNQLELIFGEPVEEEIAKLERLEKRVEAERARRRATDGTDPARVTAEVMGIAGRRRET